MEKLVAAQINFWRNRSWPKNWVLKLFSFFFAIFLWYFVVGEDKVDMTLSIPVEIVNLPQNLIISNQFKNQIEITVNGPRGLIRRIADRHISRAVDLSDATPGTIVIKNTPETISLPSGVRLLRIKPSDIILQMDRVIQKNIPIIAVTNGKPKEGFELISVKFDPQTIPMTGPQRILEKEKRFSTLPIDIQGVTHSFQIATSLDLSEDIADLLGEIIVSANIAIREKRVTKKIKNIPVLVNVAAKKIDYSLDPKFITVTAEVPLSKSGDKKKLATMFTAKLKLDNLSPGIHTIPVDVIAEKGVKVSSIQPETIVVEIQNIPENPSQEQNSKGP
jgi:YbbR domain-containing protein